PYESLVGWRVLCARVVWHGGHALIWCARERAEYERTAAAEEEETAAGRKRLRAVCEPRRFGQVGHRRSDARRAHEQSGRSDEARQRCLQGRAGQRRGRAEGTGGPEVP